MIIEGEDVVNDDVINNGTAETDGTIQDGGDTQVDEDLATLDDPNVSLDEKAELAFVMGVEKALPDAAKPKADNAAAPAQAPAAAPVAAAPAPAAAPAAKTPDAAVEKEIKDLGLKAKAADRFRELTTELSASKPLREALQTLKIEKPEQLQQIMGDAKFGSEMNEAIERTSATPEQFGNAFTVIGAMNSGNPELMGRAVELMLDQCRAVAQQIGMDIPGMLDILDQQGNHDLKQAVELGETTREIAVQTAKLRGVTAQRQRADQQAADRSNQSAELSKVQQSALESIKAWGDGMRASDPTYAARFQLLNDSGVLQQIMKNTPPSRWELETIKAYHAVKVAPASAPAPAPAPAGRMPRPGNVPVRGGNPAVRVQPKPQSDEEAFRAGMLAVSPHLDGAG